VDGFPVTTLARTCFDLAGDPDPELRRTAAGRAFHLRKIERLVNDALARRGLTFTAEAAVLGALAKRGRRGTVLIRSLLKKFGPNYVPTHSDGESLFAELAEAFGLPPYERQVRISGPRGYIGTVDGLFRPWRHVVEIDSTWHDGPLDVADDAARDEALVTAGYEITRVRYWRMVLEGEKVMAELLARLDPGFL
jgi:hypothetical protein